MNDQEVKDSLPKEIYKADLGGDAAKYTICQQLRPMLHNWYNAFWEDWAVIW